MEVLWCCRVIAHHPYAILMAVFLLSSICFIVPLATKKFPDFSDPQLGFEARGTTLAQRLTAWQNLMDASKPRGVLIDNPLEYYHYIKQLNEQIDSKIQNYSWTSQGIIRKKSKKNKKKGKKYQKFASNDTKQDVDMGNVTDKWEELLHLKDRGKLNDINEEKIQDSLDSDMFFCNLPTSAYARVVIGIDSEGKSLWSMDGVLAQCHIDEVLRSNSHFPSLCQTQIQNNGARHKCCRSWSPANYVAFLSNRSSCLGVTETDLNKVETLLDKCVSYYRSFQLTPNCAEDLNCQRRVPTECSAHNAVYHLLHYLLDVDFIADYNRDGSAKMNSTLKYAMLFLPIAASSATLDFYKSINNGGLSYGKFDVKGMQLGLKSTLFDRLLVSDSSLVLSGFAFITACIWVYTGSLVLTVTIIFAVIFSLGISYALYTLVLRIKFFPFMNLLAIVVAVGQYSCPRYI